MGGLNIEAPPVFCIPGGATTGWGDIADGGTQTTVGAFGLPGMLLQVQTTLASVTPIATTSLFVVWGGPNDFFSGGSASLAVADELSIVAALQRAGATHILVPGMPNLALTPNYYGNASAMAFSVTFNQALVASLPQGVTYFDTLSFFNQIVSIPARTASPT